MTTPIALPMPWLRSISEAFMPDVCTIQRYTEVSTGDGTTQTWAPIATNVPCRLSRRGEAAAEDAGSEGVLRAVGQRRIKLPIGTDVTVKDRIVSRGITFEVNDVPPISYDADVTALCRQIT